MVKKMLLAYSKADYNESKNDSYSVAAAAHRCGLRHLPQNQHAIR
jgi:hypothetical protein